jgi:DNA-binding CsgD family transcriptional regulator
MTTSTAASASTSVGLIGQLDSAGILLDLQRGNEIAQSLVGCLEPEGIARRVTAGIVEKFDCAFARLWLLESEQSLLRLVASSGMYTNLNGRFARVPLGAYKVGKIAQNRVAFLSNQLSDEAWVGDREWAIANRIRGFAGYPLTANDRVVGVLAVFSQQGMAAEFLEVLQMLCTISAIALDTALHYQKEKQQAVEPHLSLSSVLLSDQLVSILHTTRLTLVGTEQPLSPAVAFTFLQTAELLHQLDCTYCRLIYDSASVILEAIVPYNSAIEADLQSAFSSLLAIASCLGGKLTMQMQDHQRAVQVILELPDSPPLPSPPAIRIQCTMPLLQIGFTQLARLAGLTLQVSQDAATPVLTNDLSQLKTAKQVLWIQQGTQPPPKGVQAIIDLSTTPEQLQQAVATVQRGEQWGIATQLLSERELEILQLLTQGHRDRDIADQLVISESTVKFHMNNIQSKLNVRTRYQAIHQAVVQGWL